ncbi:uncharacterized protein PGTG_06064 [Puccinia graminis f. sp. tritici CRL 75-36-700-3]|uniref:Uncharacterized protein n=1 Tax=Puccinia graminis f. sp. tritici (strain CRL 75-36-700-3 / race SCCL) TaxID=418459 RepID=E3K5E7_PUCGT|nr:uncharacterized protein PGTG_06064 [Puccinia graminis f. sp. tritici CRL 75-36-700-3]EFP79743.1 hypothetical protein PGTG_06064 [Puccinia graminis f. sp. tritici CRL 75-36-700-3]
MDAIHTQTQLPGLAGNPMALGDEGLIPQDLNCRPSPAIDRPIRQSIPHLHTQLPSQPPLATNNRQSPQLPIYTPRVANHRNSFQFQGPQSTGTIVWIAPTTGE